jgi:diguanylate cyclase (GGDEF)-like protein
MDTSPAIKLKNFFQVLKLKRENYALKQRIKDLETDIIHDALTGLKTRRFFYEELGRNLRMIFQSDHHKRLEHFGFTKLSVAFLDVDNFKKINDTYGHDVGDKVLRAVAHTITRKIWERDIAARLGGEEMAVMFLGADEREAYEKAEMIRKKIGEIKIKDFDKIKVTVSVGVAQAFNTSADKAIKEADSAMYKAKMTGKNRTVQFSTLHTKHGKSSSKRKK